MVKGRNETSLTNDNGTPFFAVPGNAGPRTMDYEALFARGTYQLHSGTAVFAGTTDDAFWIDLGAAFDTANFRTLGSGVPGVLTADEDGALTRRRDIVTVDTYAWALFKAGRRTEARKHIAEVLAVGTTDPTVRRHAAVIQRASKKPE